MVIHLWPGSLPASGAFQRACDRYPRWVANFHPRPGRRPGVSVWPCTAWGLSCPGGCPPGGGLLPRLFTLATTPVRARRGGLFSVTLSIDRNFRPDPPRAFPRHAALWCSDFPLPPKRERPSTRDHSILFQMIEQLVGPDLEPPVNRARDETFPQEHRLGQRQALRQTRRDGRRVG